MTSTLCSGYECVEEATNTVESVQNVDSITADQQPLTQVVSTVTVPGLPHSTNNPEHSVVVNSDVAIDLRVNIKQQRDKLHNKISMHDDGYDTLESNDDLTPEPLEAKHSVFCFGNAAKNKVGVKKDTNSIADIHKRERDAHDWAMKSLFVIGTASVALSTIHESYVDYCEVDGTKPLPILQLERLLKSVFPAAAIQNKIVHGVKKGIFIGLQLLGNEGMSRTELEQENNSQVSGSDHSHDLKEEISDQGYNSDNSQTDDHNLSDASQNDVPSKFDIEYEQNNGAPEDLSIEIPQQLVGGSFAGVRFSEPLYATEAEPAGKIKEIRRAVQNYQQQVENRCTNFENVNKNSSISAENCKGALSTISAEVEAESCKGAAKRLSQVITWMKDNGHTKILLRDFAHSASCGVVKCTPFCMMFRRVRRHVVLAKHQCVLLRLYSILLRLHVSSCSNDNCGLQACPTLRANKSIKRSTSEDTNTLTKRISSGTMIQSDRVVPNSLLVTTSASKQSDRVVPNPLLVPTTTSNNAKNQVVVVLALPANRREYPK